MDTSAFVVGVLRIEKVRQVRPHANGAPVAVNVGVAIVRTATSSPKMATGPVPAHASSELQASGAHTHVNAVARNGESGTPTIGLR